MADTTTEMIPAQLAEDAYVRIGSILPAIRAGAEALDKTDTGQALWAASYLLESVSQKLGSATGWE
jgi:hypothetical protein